MLKINWDNANTRLVEAEEWLKVWSKILEWIVEGGGVERRVGDFRGCLKEDG